MFISEFVSALKMNLGQVIDYSSHGHSNYDGEVSSMQKSNRLIFELVGNLFSENSSSIQCPGTAKLLCAQ